MNIFINKRILKKKKPKLYSKSIPKKSDATAPGILEKKNKFREGSLPGDVWFSMLRMSLNSCSEPHVITFWTLAH